MRVGLVGCGGRGMGAAVEAVIAAGDRGAVITALGDVDPMAVAEVSERLGRRLGSGFDVPRRRRFAGSVACEEVCAAGVDIVILAATAGVRPAHVSTAVESGLHVYAERPLGIDRAGLDVVASAGRMAAAKGLSFVTSLALRYDRLAAAAIDRVRGEGNDVREVTAFELPGGLAAERCIDALDAAMKAVGGHDLEWTVNRSGRGVAFRGSDGRCVRIVFDDAVGSHGRMVARRPAGSVEFVTPLDRRRATAHGLRDAWAALLESIRSGRPINDSQEACRAHAIARSASISGPTPLSKTA